MSASTTRPVKPGPKPLGRRIVFLCFVMSPLAVLAILMWLIAMAIERGPQMENQRIGAGAGNTGGANAIGDIMAGRWDETDESDSEEHTPETENVDQSSGDGQ